MLFKLYTVRTFIYIIFTKKDKNIKKDFLLVLLKQKIRQNLRFFLQILADFQTDHIWLKLEQICFEDLVYFQLFFVLLNQLKSNKNYF